MVSIENNMLYMCNVYICIVISFPEAIVDDRAQQLVVRYTLMRSCVVLYILFALQSTLCMRYWPYVQCMCTYR